MTLPVDECVAGFRLVGQASSSPQFPHGFIPMQQTPEELQTESNLATQVQCCQVPVDWTARAGHAGMEPDP